MYLSETCSPYLYTREAQDQSPPLHAFYLCIQGDLLDRNLQLHMGIDECGGSRTLTSNN